MVYEFRCLRCGLVKAVQLPISKAPKFGATIGCRCGGRARRIVSTEATFADADLKRQVHNDAFEVFTVTGLDGTRPGPNGGCLIESERHRREVVARNPGVVWI